MRYKKRETPEQWEARLEARLKKARDRKRIQRAKAKEKKCL